MEVFLLLFFVFFFFPSFFHVISFPTKNNYSSPNGRDTKEGYERAPSFSPSLSLSGVLLNNLTIFLFIENANDGSQHLRDMLPFSTNSSSLFFILISVFFSVDVKYEFLLASSYVTDRHASHPLPPSLSRISDQKKRDIPKGNEQIIQSIYLLFVPLVNEIEIGLICT